MNGPVDEVLLGAQKLLDLGRPHEALAIVERYLTTDPRSVEALVLMGQAQLDVGNPECARANAQQALQVAPDLPVALLLLSVAQTELRRLPDALHAAEQVAAANPTWWAAHAQIAEVRLAGSRTWLPEAESAARETLELNPDAPVGHPLLARCLEQAGQREAADEHTRIAARLDPSSDPAQQTLSVRSWQQGREREAVEAVYTGLSVAPQSRAWHALRAQMLLAWWERVIVIARRGYVVFVVALITQWLTLNWSPSPNPRKIVAIACLALAIGQVASLIRAAPRHFGWRRDLGDYRGPGRWVALWAFLTFILVQLAGCRRSPSRRSVSRCTSLWSWSV